LWICSHFFGSTFLSMRKRSHVATPPSRSSAANVSPVGSAGVTQPIEVSSLAAFSIVRKRCFFSAVGKPVSAGAVILPSQKNTARPPRLRIAGMGRGEGSGCCERANGRRGPVCFGGGGFACSFGSVLGGGSGLG